MTGQLKDQNGDNLGIAQTIDLPLESVVVNGSYDSQTKKVVLTLQNGNTIEFSVADLVSGLQTELSASNKLNPAYIEYDSSHRAVSDTEKSTWNDKQNALSSTQLSAVNSGITSADVEQITTTADNEAEDRAALVEIVDNSAKNVMPITATSQTIYMVSFTVNSDGTITTSGIMPVGLSSVAFTAAEFDIPAGAYHYSCEGGSVQNQRDSYVQAYDGTSWNVLARDYADSDFTISETTHIRVCVRVYPEYESGTFKPMICTQAAWDISQTYQPYRPSYQELYEMVKALQAQLGNITIKIITKAEYDSIPHAANTVYYVKDGDKVVQYLGDAKLTVGTASGNLIFPLDSDYGYIIGDLQEGE